MAANYWDSTQARYWTFTKEELKEMELQLFRANRNSITKYPLPEQRLLNIFLQGQLLKLGRRMNLRQQALATAQVYVRRFYTKVEIRKTNPYSSMTTAVYLACKMEECPVHIRLMLAEAARQWPESGINDSSKIGECEFALISTLQARSVLHHPYRTLTDSAPTFSMSTEEISSAHSIINDHYNTDSPLMHPPHIIAVTAIFLAIVLRPNQTGSQQHSAGAASAERIQANMNQASSIISGTMGKQHHAKLGRLVEWSTESDINMEAVISSTQELISLYEVWEGYSERPCKEAISRFMKDGLGK